MRCQKMNKILTYVKRLIELVEVFCESVKNNFSTQIVYNCYCYFAILL